MLLSIYAFSKILLSFFLHVASFLGSIVIIRTRRLPLNRSATVRRLEARTKAAREWNNEIWPHRASDRGLPEQQAYEFLLNYEAQIMTQLHSSISILYKGPRALRSRSSSNHK